MNINLFLLYLTIFTIRDTYIERNAGESPNDRNDRAIRVATKWYDKHLKISQSKSDSWVRAVLLTDDVDNRIKAEKEEIFASTIVDYIRSLGENYNVLEDKISRKNYESEGSNICIYPPHLKPFEIHEGIKSGEIYQGSFIISRDNYLEGFVNCESFEKSVLIQGRSALNRAVDGDIVAFRVFQESKWSAPSEVILQDENNDPEEIPDDEKKLQAATEDSSLVDKQPTGEIVGIIRRKWRQYCGIIQHNPVKGSTRHIFIPAERKIPRVRIESRQAEQLYMKRIIVAIDQWPRHSRYVFHYFKF